MGKSLDFEVLGKLMVKQWWWGGSQMDTWSKQAIQMLQKQTLTDELTSLFILSLLSCRFTKNKLRLLFCISNCFCEVSIYEETRIVMVNQESSLSALSLFAFHNTVKNFTPLIGDPFKTDLWPFLSGDKILVKAALEPCLKSNAHGF